MRETLFLFRQFAQRCKLITALLSLFLSGALIALGAASWYYDVAVQRIYATHTSEVAALRDALDKAKVNRAELVSLTGRIATLTDRVEKAINDAASAASAAKSAAVTAKGAAANAAKGQIRVTERPREVAPRHRFPERIEP